MLIGSLAHCCDLQLYILCITLSVHSMTPCCTSHTAAVVHVCNWFCLNLRRCAIMPAWFKRMLQLEGETGWSCAVLTAFGRLRPVFGCKETSCVGVCMCVRVLPLLSSLGGWTCAVDWFLDVIVNYTWLTFLDRAESKGIGTGFEMGRRSLSRIWTTSWRQGPPVPWKSTRSFGCF